MLLDIHIDSKQILARKTLIHLILFRNLILKKSKNTLLQANLRMMIV